MATSQKKHVCDETLAREPNCCAATAGQQAKKAPCNRTMRTELSSRGGDSASQPNTAGGALARDAAGRGGGAQRRSEWGYRTSGAPTADPSEPL